ncbi:MAG: hypothetical protein WDM81_07710 [Rhizomicrobium sp.]
MQGAAGERKMNLVVKVLGSAALGAVLAAQPLSALAAAPIAAPLHTSGVKAVYPRLSGLADARAMARVNALLAAQETTDRAAYTDCLSQLKEMKMTPDKDSYVEDITVRYLSAHYFSVEVVTSYYCAGAYPTNGAEAPMTFDLTASTQIDWSAMFKPGFLPPDTADEHTPPSVLTKLYRARYSKAKDDADCRQAINDQDPFSSAPIVWLDAKGGVVLQPDFPHVIAACATPLTLSPAEIAPYLKDAMLAADLKATVHR